MQPILRPNRSVTVRPRPGVESTEHIELRYIDTGGDVNAHTIVLCHGWPDISYTWRYQIPLLINLGFRVIAPDLLGFGQSSTPIGIHHYTMKKMCGDLAFLLDSLCIEKAVFIGHDWGGALVWRMALWFPQKVTAVCGICTPYRPCNPQFIPIEIVATKLPNFYYQVYFNKQDGQLATQELNQSPLRTLRCLHRSVQPADQLQGAKWMKSTHNSLLETHPINPPSSLTLNGQDEEIYVNAFSATGFGPSLQWYRTGLLNWQDEIQLESTTISHNALMITTGKDIVLNPTLSEGMEKFIPHLKRAHIEDAGHWVQHEQSQQLNTILTQWLQSLTFLQPKL
eukprot:TRINITY_DN643_c1_g1_i1.p1 TRINITY_DN643_c1_g1~~TRINITY_DN643_c1_g1_i1.p1  ORF type:complete len:339 (+),score=158.00 TRINITY_DN643_c1_g1_i1:92-1108(+)